MDGIFGVGIMEMILVVLVLFIVGGPENTVKWAGQLGRWIGAIRAELRKIWYEIEADMDDETKEFVREVRTAANDVRSVQQTSRNMVRESLQLIEGADAKSSQSATTNTTPDTSAQGDADGPGKKQYPAWLPPEE
ncbi:MAG: hypothetical protein K8S97_07775 [Anaerolineae bacterium]|nr:hypothetical protein [Anaerolineae bacterium]